jgi:hypothetical protein
MLDERRPMVILLNGKGVQTAKPEAGNVDPTRAQLHTCYSDFPHRIESVL